MGLEGHHFIVMTEWEVKRKKPQAYVRLSPGPL
jgi:hypothetical protein